MNSPGLRKMPPPVLTAAVVAFGVLIGALILEGAARVLWKAPWYDQLLAYQRDVQTYDYTKNRWGLRDTSPLSAKPDGVRRIFMLGDSFTHGLGVMNDDLIFAELIEKRLQETGVASAPRGIELMNAGLPATLTGDWVETWSRFGVEYAPDLVVVVFFLRDGTEQLLIPEFFMRIRQDIVKRNDASYGYRNFYTYRLIRDRLDRNHIAQSYTQHFVDAYFGTTDQTTEWRVAQQNLRWLRDEAHRHNAKFALVVFPILVELNESYPFMEICNTIATFGETLDVPVCNLLPDLIGLSAPGLWVSPWDQHPNAECHAIVADALEPFLRKQLEP